MKLNTNSSMVGAGLSCCRPTSFSSHVSPLPIKRNFFAKRAEYSLILTLRRRSARKRTVIAAIQTAINLKSYNIRVSIFRVAAGSMRATPSQ